MTELDFCLNTAIMITEQCLYTDIQTLYSIFSHTLTLMINEASSKVGIVNETGFDEQQRILKLGVTQVQN